MEQIPIILYHYCSMESFYSIVTNKNLRLSDSRCTNDYYENVWIVKFVNELLSKYAKEYPDKIQILQQCNDYIVQRIDMPYIACFSEDSDLLSQWRAYANDGKGVAIGFKIKIPVGLPYFYAGEDILGNSLKIEKVIYNPKVQKQGIEMLLKKALQCDCENFGFIGNDIRLLSYIYKHPTFSEEKEWRIINSVFMTSDNIAGGAYSQLKFRTVNDRMISFIEIPIGSDNGLCDIKEVILGPKNCTMIDTLHYFLEFNNFRDVVIKKSIAPYR